MLSAVRAPDIGYSPYFYYSLLQVTIGAKSYYPHFADEKTEVPELEQGPGPQCFVPMRRTSRA